MSYIGRFAPSPTGELHFGSLIAAVGSYVDAKANDGQWLLRFEDVDTTRCRMSYRESMLRTLARFGLNHDGEVVVQTDYLDTYQVALDALSDVTYQCTCSRKIWQKHAIMGEIGKVYPQTCLKAPSNSSQKAVVRLNLPNETVIFEDRRLSKLKYNLATQIGDPVLHRRNGDFAYALAVCVDDARQGMTHIVRGEDLLPTTPIHIIIQHHLGYPTPSYLHLPLALDQNGLKLSKQNHAKPINHQDDDAAVSDLLVDVVEFLDSFFVMKPPNSLRQALPNEVLDWAVAHWRRI